MLSICATVLPRVIIYLLSVSQSEQSSCLNMKKVKQAQTQARHSYVCMGNTLRVKIIIFHEKATTDPRWRDDFSSMYLLLILELEKEHQTSQQLVDNIPYQTPVQTSRDLGVHLLAGFTSDNCNVISVIILSELVSPVWVRSGLLLIRLSESSV